MLHIKKIMVAVDFSDYSLPSVQYAHQLAQDLGVPIILVNVLNERDVRTIEMAMASYDPALALKQVENQKEWRQMQLNDLEQQAGAQGTVIKKVIRMGVPYQELLAAIEEEKVDLLIMSTKGRSNLADTLLGSCAQKMFRRCPVPLLSLRPQK